MWQYEFNAVYFYVFISFTLLPPQKGYSKLQYTLESLVILPEEEVIRSEFSA